MKRWERLISGLLTPMNANATIILGLFTMVWGIWIILPFRQVFNSAPLFQRVKEFAPEWAWGAWATLCGLLLIAALLRQQPKVVSFSLGFCTWHWFVISGLLWWGDWHNTGGLTYTFIALYSLWAYLNYRINFTK